MIDTRTFDHQGKRDGYFKGGNGPYEKWGPGIWEGLIIHFTYETIEIKDLTYAGIQKKQDQ